MKSKTKYKIVILRGCKFKLKACDSITWVKREQEVMRNDWDKNRVD